MDHLQVLLELDGEDLRHAEAAPDLPLASPPLPLPQGTTGRKVYAPHSNSLPSAPSYQHGRRWPQVEPNTSTHRPPSTPHPTPSFTAKRPLTAGCFKRLFGSKQSGFLTRICLKLSELFPRAAAVSPRHGGSAQPPGCGGGAAPATCAHCAGAALRARLRRRAAFSGTRRGVVVLRWDR